MALNAVDLKCEYLINPMGLDIKKPSLSWRMEAFKKGTMQTAYRVKVAKCRAGQEFEKTV